MKMTGADKKMIWAFVLYLLTATLSVTSTSNVRFSKLLNEKSEFLRFTSLANTANSSVPFQNVYSRNDASNTPFPQTHSVSQKFDSVADDDYETRVREQLQSDPTTSVQHSPGILTLINQKPISGRTQVTALRQSISPRRLNISPVFLTNEDAQQNPNQPINSPENPTEVPLDDETQYPDHDKEQKSTNPKRDDSETIPSRSGILDSLTVFDNRTQADQNYATTPVSKDLERESELAESFPDFEDLPTNLVGAESSQPARVNVRPASSGKNYEYEYIYYYYDDDDDNATTPRTRPTTQPLEIQTPTELTHIQRLYGKEGEINVNIEQEQYRNYKSLASDVAPNVASLPEPQKDPSIAPQLINNRPIVIKQSNIPEMQRHYTTTPQANDHLSYHINTETQPTTHLPQTDVPNYNHKTQPPSLNTFEPPVLQFKLIDTPSTSPSSPQPPPPTHSRAPNRSQKLNQFESVRETYQEEPHLEVTSPRRKLTRRPHPSGVVGPEVQQRVPPLQNAESSESVTEQPHESVRTLTTAVHLQDYGRSPSPTLRGSAPTITEHLSTIDTNSAAQPSIPHAEKHSDINFARQKSVNDLYALSRLHQLAINTKIPDKKFPDSTRNVVHSPVFKTSAEFSRAPEVVTTYGDDMEESESTTISSFALPGPVATTTEIHRIPQTTTEAATLYTPTHEATSTTQQITSSGDPRPHSSFNTRFRGRERTPVATTSTSTEQPRRPPQHNRFSGRPRTLSTTGTSSVRPPPSDIVSSGTSVRESTTPDASPHNVLPVATRNRFASRTRSTTSTQAPSPLPSPTEVDSKPQRRNRGPPAGAPFNQRRRLPTSTALPVSNDVEPPVDLTEAARPFTAPSGETSGSPTSQRVRNRPAGVRPNLLRSGRTSTTTTTTTLPPPVPDESSDATNEQTGETIGPTASEVIEPLPTTGKVEEGVAGSIKHKVSVSSSTTISESEAEPPKRGIAGVLGRLRSRSKANSGTTISSTTNAPEGVPTTTERKPSRVSGILNRRKQISTTTFSPVAQEGVGDAESAAPKNIPSNGVIVQVSSVVSESEEVGDNQHHPEVPPNPPPVPPTNPILSRLKSHRKPGSIAKRPHE